MQKEKTITVQELPISTGECDYGPQIQYTLGECIIKYDYESESGIKWVTIIWNTALAIKTIPSTSISNFHLAGYNKISKVENSNWLKSLSYISNTRHESLGNGLSHYLIYFDHECSIEIIAKSFKVIPIPVKD
ncbi:MAG: hypothetical protein COB02_17290 [Candidatus Cloacimonadota bacterium]|nr:MAG: hypothetical protein COB02_17290 [Candidatus Cloacimonadota bacterium]